MSQEKVQANGRIGGVLFSKDTHKKKQRSTAIKKKKNILLRPRSLERHHTMQITSAGTRHALKQFHDLKRE